MSKLSPRYRNDKLDVPPAEIKAYLDEHFLRQLPNLQAPHPKLLVVFSGGNGVGKSSLATRLQHDLQALVLENDEIKMRLLDFNPAYERDDLSQLTWRYSMDLYARLSEVTPNGLVVRDGVIDWYYDRILPVFQEQGYELFVVSFDVSREKRIELIKKRGDKAFVNFDRYMKLLEDHDIHTARFRREHRPDVVLTDDNLFDYDPVVTTLRARLQSLAQQK